MRYPRSRLQVSVICEKEGENYPIKFAFYLARQLYDNIHSGSQSPKTTRCLDRMIGALTGFDKGHAGGCAWSHQEELLLASKRL